MKIRTSFCFLLLLSLASSLHAQNAVKVPGGVPVLPDGKCKAEEWNDAAEVVISNDYRLYLKKTDHYVFLCIKPSQERLFSVDLYLSPADGKMYTLHVSAKLGERMLEGDKWKEWTVDWNWWDVDGWWANALRPSDFEKRVFLPHQAIEFQISRKRFGGEKWRVMLERGSLVFPSGANNLKRETWLEVDLGK
jgi:hypothetical protein